MAVENMIVGLGSGVYVALGVGEGGVYMAVCVAKKDATIEPTAEVIKTSALSVGVPLPVQATKINTVKINMLLKYFFIGSPL